MRKLVLTASLFVLLVAGCTVGALTTQYPTASFDPFNGAESVTYINDPSGMTVGKLTVWRRGNVVLTGIVNGNLCGRMSGFPPSEYESGKVVSIPRAFVGSAPGVPAVGDTLTGTVILSAVIDTLVISEGGFEVVCTAPDTLEGYAWVSLPANEPCGRDSLATYMRFIREY